MTALLLVAFAATLAVLAWRLLRRGRRGRAVVVVGALLAMQALIGSPAMAAPTDCAPNPERPDLGFVGALDPSKQLALHGDPGSVYFDYRYAGLTWHVYNPNCGSITAVTGSNSEIDTWFGNQLFNVAKVMVGATNGLHYVITGNLLTGPLDDIVANGTKALYNGVFAPLFALAALGLAILLFRQIWKGDLAAIGKRTTWALAGLWLASAAYLTPLVYTEVLDKVLIFGTSEIQAGFLSEVGLGSSANSLPTMLHTNVVYRNWLRGEFGDPDAPQATQFGRDLVGAQAFSIAEVNAGKDADANNSNAKKQQFVDIRGKLGNVTGYFDGTDGSRIGDGFLALFQALAFSLFQLLAKAAILLAQVLLRMVVLAGPLIGLASIVFPDLLRKIGRAAGAALLNVVVISALAGLDTLVLVWIFDPAHGLPLLAQILLAGLVTFAFFMIGKPGRRMMQMVQLSVGTMGSNLAGAGGGLWARMRGRRTDTSAQDAFWENVRDGEHLPPEIAAAQRGGRRYRPEASNPVLATAQRLDVNGTQLAAGSTRALSSGGGGAAALPSGGGGIVGPMASRTVDTPPVVDRSWERRGEDAVIVPSQVVSGQRPQAEPRRAEVEVIAGRPVHMIYRPSRGLEVAEPDGPQYGRGERG
ncbi:hypothetical protein [Kutzneria sp. NPDC051319]|uniref:hypothetical protein n=1 Tax=Kutzneria sp. NPDC051319 TaxID=3155047 RepID=UPI00343F8907